MFVLKNLGILGGEAKGGASIRLYSYIIPKEDTFNDLLSDGYFNNQKGEFLENDIIMVLDVDKIKYLIVKEAGLRSIKVEQISFYKLSDLTPQISSISGSAGISENMARADHRHKKAVATESERGEIVIATEEEVNEGIDNTKAITPLKLKNKINEVNENISNNVELLNKSIEDNINTLKENKANVDLDNITENAENKIRELIVKNGSLPLFTTLWSDHLLNDASYLRSDTFSWQSGNIYVSAYDKLVEEKATVSKQKYISEDFKNQIMTAETTNDWTATASNTNGSYSAWKAFNGNFTTSNDCWYSGNLSSTTTESWIQLQSPEANYIKSVYIKNEIETAQNFKNAIIQGSTDGSIWDNLYTITDRPNTVGYEETYTVNSNNKYNYVRLLITENYTTSGVSIQEIEIEYQNYFIYYKSTNGFNIVDPTQEQNIINLFNNNGIAWFYILDEENKQFKLPRSKYNFVGYRNNVGGYVEESLPNITGTFTSGVEGDFINRTGAFYDTKHTGSLYGYRKNASANMGMGFDASLSSSTYQDNAPVQQRATEMYLYFYVGNTVRNETEINVGALTEQLNTKVDINELQNICIGYPDYSAGVTFTIPSAGNTFTVEYDCFLYIADRTNTGGTIILKNNDTDGTEILGMGAGDSFTYTCANVFLKKGQVVYVQNTKNNLICVMYPLI